MTIKDNFAAHNTGLTSPADNAFAITPHATDLLPFVTRGIYIGGAGDLAVVMENGGTTVITFKDVPAGTLLPIRAKRVTTASAATHIVGLY
jgi:hypothetical protein